MRDMMLDDIIVFRKVKKGDSEAYELLFKKYYKELYRFAFTYLRDVVPSEEMVQEVFLYIWEKREQIEIHTTLKTYLYSAVKNKCLNYIKLEVSKQQSAEDVNDVVLSISSKREDEGENEVLKKHIARAIEALPVKCKRIFVLSRNAGLTYDEIAEELDISKKTVENQMGIALKKLRESLQGIYAQYKETFY